MKKTLLAMALLGAMAGTAAAADVTVYGVVDLGLKYTHEDTDLLNSDAKDSLTVNSGGQSGSRFGLKGSEDLGNGLTAGFVLENGFNADDGTLGNSGRLFGRESNLYLQGRFGTISFGCVGQLTSGNGSYGITGNLSPFGTSWGGSVEGSTFMVGFARMDNTVTYVSPEFAGAKVYAQYSFDGNTKDKWDNGKDREEGKASATRYAGLGVTYGAGALNLVATGDWYQWSNNEPAVGGGDELDDGFAFTLGGSYDFQVVKAYLGGQYFDNMLMKSSDAGNDAMTLASIGVGTSGYIQGYGLMAGVDAPVFGGKAMFAVGYASTEDADTAAGVKEAESDRWGVSAGYTYDLSKRTNLYTVVTYYQDKVEGDNTEGLAADDKDRDPSKAQFFVGMRHRF